MSRAVLDASIALAMLFDERGLENLPADILDRGLMSTVNVAEVQGKLVRMGRIPEDAWEDLASLGIAAQSYTKAHAKIAGSLIGQTQPFGLSLGDRSCLALAISLQAPVYTTEQIWRKLEIGVPIHVIRD